MSERIGAFKAPFFRPIIGCINIAINFFLEPIPE
jgi:hypothetical protein